MRISGKIAFLVLGLLVFSIASSALTHSVNGASTQNNITETAASDTNLTTNNVIQKLDNHDTNVSESQSSNSESIQRNRFDFEYQPFKYVKIGGQTFYCQGRISIFLLFFFTSK